MAILRDEGVVLRRRDFRDTSLLLTLLTSSHGKVSGIVKGIKGSRGKYHTSFEPVTRNEIVFYERRNQELVLITEGDVLQDFGGVSRGVKETAYASYFAEVVERLTEPRDAHPELYRLLVAALDEIASCEHHEWLTRAFEAKCLARLGVMPRIDSCVSCGQVSLQSGGFNARAGGYLCATCAGRIPEAIPCHSRSRQLLEQLVHRPWAELASVIFSANDMAEVKGALRQAIDEHLDQPLRSLSVLRSLVNNAYSATYSST